MNRIVVQTLALAGALSALYGCGGQTTKAQLPADVLRGAITPVASSAPEGVLSPVGNVSRTAGVAPQAATPANRGSAKPAATKAASTKSTPTRYASDRAVRAKSASSAAAPPETAPGKPAGSTAAPVTVAPSSSLPSSVPAVEAKPIRLSSPTGFVIVEQVPEAVVRVPPEYPVPPRDVHIEGTVTIQALVGADGKVYDTRVVRSIPMLDAAAKAAVMQWKFTPALSGGRPVAVWFDVPVTFSLP